MPPAARPWHYRCNAAATPWGVHRCAVARGRQLAPTENSGHPDIVRPYQYQFQLAPVRNIRQSRARLPLNSGLFVWLWASSCCIHDVLAQTCRALRNALDIQRFSMDRWRGPFSLARAWRKSSGRTARCRPVRYPRRIQFAPAARIDVSLRTEASAEFYHALLPADRPRVSERRRFTNSQRAPSVRPPP